MIKIVSIIASILLVIGCSTPQPTYQGIITSKSHLKEYSLLLRLPGGYLKKIRISKKCYESCVVGEYVLVDAAGDCVSKPRKHRFHPEEFLNYPKK